MVARLVFVAALAGCGPAVAETLPAYLPARDVAVTYHVTGAPAGPLDVVARWSARLLRARIEMGPVYVLADTRARTARLVMEQANLTVELPSGNVDAYLPGPGTRFSRTGTDTVAGLSCTAWRAETAKGSGTACLTDDGVLLRGTGVDRNGRGGGSIEASAVVYADQPVALFQGPPAAGKR